MKIHLGFLSMFVVAACGGKTAPVDSVKAAVAEIAALEYGADYKSYTKLNKEPFMSPTHGKRFVDVYVNDAGLEAYKGDGEVPAGTVVVKTSWETKDGQPTDVAGPTFVMAKRAAGFDPENNDWWYAMYWPDVPANWQKRMGAAAIYWKSPEKKVGYCVDCHSNYDRELGGIPDDKKAW